MEADALIIRTPGVGLFLPIADCIATVMYDPKQRVLALLHLGRHSTLTDLVADVVRRFIVYGSRPEDTIVWMSPSIKSESYKMEYFDQSDDSRWREFCVKDESGYYVDLPGFNESMFLVAGVPPQNINISPINVASGPGYFSHFMGDTTERFAVLAMMH